MRQRAVRPVFVYALGVAAAAAWALTLLPSPEERAYRALAAEQAAIEEAGCELLSSAPGRARYLAALRGLQRASAIRRLRELAELSLKCAPLPREDAQELLDVVFYDFNTWNTRPQPWKLAVLARYRSALPIAKHDLEAFFRSAPVTLTFRPSRRYPRLWVEGGWDGDGALDGLGGWRAEPLAFENGTWTEKRRLARTIGNNPYHAVIRTAPWPDGEAVAYAQFRVDGPRELAFEPLSPRPAAERESALEAGPRSELAILGVDGASWHVLLPLIHAGLLPNFSRLLREGAVSELTSTGETYGSLSNIYVAMTGKVPSRHGMDMHDYFRFDAGPRARPLWWIASDARRRTLAVSMWQTFPPGAIYGDMVTEAFFPLDLYWRPRVKEFALSRDSLMFAQLFGVSGASIRNVFDLLSWVDGTVATTYPAALEDSLRAGLPRPDDVHDVPSLTKYLDAAVAAVVDKVTTGDRFDLICAYLSSVDNASHVFWGGFEPAEISFRKNISDTKVRDAVSRLPPAEGRLARSYEDADKLLGLMMRRARNVLLFSDHGFGSDMYDYLYLQFHLDAFLKDAEHRGVPGLPKGAEVSGRSQYFLLWLPSDEKGRAYAQALVAELSRARYLPHRSPMFGEIELGQKDGLLTLRFTQLQPHPIFINALEVGGRKRSVMDFFGLSTLQGTHQGNGVFGLWGPAAKNVKLDEANIADVAPTALRLLGLPAARDMDGVALEQALRDPGPNEPATVASYGGGGSSWRRFGQSLRVGRAGAQLWARWRGR